MAESGPEEVVKGRVRKEVGGSEHRLGRIARRQPGRCPRSGKRGAFPTAEWEELDESRDSRPVL